MSEISPEYLAGFFDGEGCVCISYNSYKRKTPQVSLKCEVSNTNKAILLEIQRDFGGELQASKPQKKKWKTPYKLRWYGPHAAKLLAQIEDLVRIKKERVHLALDFIAFMQTPREDRRHWRDVPTTRGGSGKMLALVKTPETLKTELGFKTRMHDLNKKGVA